jgi:AcrR family transcriptional regulator
MNNRKSLLEHALRLFAERGYDAVGVQEVCEAAGVTKPTLYHYFGSKRGLLEALVGERYAPFALELAEAARYAGDLPRTLEQVVSAFFEFAAREPTLYRMVLAMWLASPASEAGRVIGDLHTEQRAVVQSLFAQAAPDHGSIRGRERTYAVTLLGMIHTYVGLFLGGELELDRQVVYRAVHQFSHGIYS